MPQGVVKSKPKPGAAAAKGKSTAHSASARSKATSGHRVATPKNARLAKAQKQIRKGAAGLTGALEKKLAERAGHTEMIGGAGSKRDGAKKPDLKGKKK